MRVIIFANGALSDPEGALRQVSQGDLIIAADGGGLYCLQLGIKPDLVVGDFDSLSEEAQEQLQAGGATFERHPAHKDKTDLELAIYAALERGAGEMIVFGALGARWDMSLANLLMLANPAFRTAHIELVDGEQRVLLIRSGETRVLTGNPGDIVSLVPLAGDARRITTQGLEYLLSEGELKYGEARGVSNVLLQRQASISVQEGDLLCILIRKS